MASRDMQHRAFMTAHTWHRGSPPTGEPGPFERGQAVAMKVGGSWRRGVAISPLTAIWVDATETRPSTLHLRNLGEGVRTAMEKRWGVSSPPHPPPSAPPWELAKVREIRISDFEVIRLDEG